MLSSGARCSSSAAATLTRGAIGGHGGPPPMPLVDDARVASLFFFVRSSRHETTMPFRRWAKRARACRLRSKARGSNDAPFVTDQSQERRGHRPLLAGEGGASRRARSFHGSELCTRGERRVVRLSSSGDIVDVVVDVTVGPHAVRRWPFVSPRRPLLCPLPAKRRDRRPQNPGVPLPLPEFETKRVAVLGPG